jgi:hypothetical protein
MHVQARRVSLDSLEFPVAERFIPAVVWLLENGYDDHNIQAALGHFARHGTAQCAPNIDPGNRDAVEALLPLDTFAWNDLTWDLSMWELGPEVDADIADPRYIPF